MIVDIWCPMSGARSKLLAYMRFVEGSRNESSQEAWWLGILRAMDDFVHQ